MQPLEPGDYYSKSDSVLPSVTSAGLTPFYLGEHVNFDDTKELRMIVVTDIHSAIENCVALQTKINENEAFRTVILCCGDMLTLKEPEMKDLDVLVKGHSEVAAMFFELTFASNVIFYIPGNHDIPEMFHPKPTTASPKSYNVHLRAVRLAPGLVLIGFGGSGPSVLDDGSVFWDGYPYKTEEEIAKVLEHLLEDIIVVQPGVAVPFQHPAVNKDFDPANPPAGYGYLQDDDQIVLMTHVGPDGASTSEDTVSTTSTIHTGSQSVRRLIENNHRIIVNVHGHAHHARGLTTLKGVPIINPGPLRDGCSAVMDLKRSAGNWKLKHIELDVM